MKQTFRFIYVLLFFSAFINKAGYAQAKFNFKEYPNPFADSIHINFTLAKPDTVSLTVCNFLGQSKDNIIQNTLLPGGSYSLIVSERALLAGTYILQLKVGANRVLTKILKANGTTGIKNTSVKSKRIILSPNPTDNLINIPITGVKNIEVTDLTGRVIKAITTEANSISLSELNNGVYLVNIYSQYNLLLTTQKIMKD